MPKQIRLNAFDMNCVGHQSPGLWTHPDDRADSYNTLEYWTDLARTLERGKFDALFLADVLGIYDVYKGSADTALANAVQVPVNDPLMVVPPMAMVTEHLGFGITCALSYELPYPFARRMSTLDHLTKGRVGWNVVTSYLPNAARNFGHEDEVEHDHRYEIADEYLDVVYKLWEGSWDDDAVIVDRDNRVYADPAKVRYINHAGPYYRVAGPHLSEPSPQRTPVIYQAGVSDAGRSFAGRHAEAIFMGGSSIAQVRTFVEDVRRVAASEGRNPSDIKFLPGANIIVGRNDEEVAKKVDEYRRLRSVEGYLAHANSAVDWTRHDRSALVGDLIDLKDTNRNRSARNYRPDQTVGELLDNLGAISRPFTVAGTPKVVVDEMERWIREGGVDGFNLIQQLTPGTARDFIELVIPELRKRGLFRQSYTDGETLRERYLGPGQARLPGAHPGARFRDPAALRPPSPVTPVASHARA